MNDAQWQTRQGLVACLPHAAPDSTYGGTSRCMAAGSNWPTLSSRCPT